MFAMRKWATKCSTLFSMRMVIFCAIASLALESTLTTQEPPDMGDVSSTQAEHDFPPARWHRSSGAPPGLHYVGRGVCAQCHIDVAEAQAQTSMGRASTKAAESDILSKHSTLSYTEGPYLLQIKRQDGQEIYSASDGQHVESVSIRWAFGRGDAGQTYVFERAGIYYESRVSYYKDIDGLNLTIGHDSKARATLSEELGRVLSDADVFKCFPCHTSEAVLNRKLHFDLMQPGVTCENCHGPGSEHLEAIQKRDWKHLHIFNPAHLDPGDLNDFCGSCHRTTYDVLAVNAHGILNVRFQPYRLEHSRCYDSTDKRISCIACHDPHVDLVTDLESYDSKCLACHVHSGEQPTATRAARACPRASKNCASCHMPKLSLPGSHYKFADHFIRVYNPTDSYPD
jgi:hypothetical protein